MHQHQSSSEILLRKFQELDCFPHYVSEQELVMDENSFDSESRNLQIAFHYFICLCVQVAFMPLFMPPRHQSISYPSNSSLCIIHNFPLPQPSFHSHINLIIRLLFIRHVRSSVLFPSTPSAPRAPAA